MDVDIAKRLILRHVVMWRGMVAYAKAIYEQKRQAHVGRRQQDIEHEKQAAMQKVRARLQLVGVMASQQGPLCIGGCRLSAAELCEFDSSSVDKIFGGKALATFLALREAPCEPPCVAGEKVSMTFRGTEPQQSIVPPGWAKALCDHRDTFRKTLSHANGSGGDVRFDVFLHEIQAPRKEALLHLICAAVPRRVGLVCALRSRFPIRHVGGQRGALPAAGCLGGRP